MTTHHEFPKATEEILATRAGWFCSNPTCRKITIGPQEDETKPFNIGKKTGIAVHITTPTPEGPRYVADLSQTDLESVENGIWLCRSCAGLIDADQQYTAELLARWKIQAELPWEFGNQMFTQKEKDKIITGHLDEICTGKEMNITPEDKTSYLDAVFCEAFDKAYYVRERLNLIEQFESGYPKYLNQSKWYKSIQRHIPDLHRLVDEEQENKRLNGILTNLKCSEVDKAFSWRDWRNLANDFLAISGRAQTPVSPDKGYASQKALELNWAFPVKNEEDTDFWWVSGGSGGDRQIFENLAKRAALALGYPGDSKGLQAWYTILKCAGSGYSGPLAYRPTELDKDEYISTVWGRIELLCRASAKYCEERATETYKNDKRPGDALLEPFVPSLSPKPHIDKLNEEERGKSISEILEKFLALVEERPKPMRRKKATPTPDEKVIIEAINEELKGKGFCLWLDNANPPVTPRPSWKRRSIYSWPVRYVRAYTAQNIEERKYWRSRIYNYRDDVKRKYPDLIRRKNSPAR
jgi:hypothetical protein